MMRLSFVYNSLLLQLFITDHKTAIICEFIDSIIGFNIDKTKPVRIQHQLLIQYNISCYFDRKATFSSTNKLIAVSDGINKIRSNKIKEHTNNLNKFFSVMANKRNKNSNE